MVYFQAIIYVYNSTIILYFKLANLKRSALLEQKSVVIRRLGADHLISGGGGGGGG